MSVMTWPDHLLTLAEFDQLPEDNSRRYELQEGVLQVTPKAAPFHQFVIARLTSELDRRLPAGWAAVPEAEVVMAEKWPPTLRIPDVIVVGLDRVQERPSKFHAQDVAIAVEVLSPGSRRMDNLVKRHEYADAGIPFYWILDIRSKLELTAHRLVDRAYKIEFEGTGTYLTDEPFDLKIELDRLGTRIVPPS
ncbi:Uma2 family endonuclease [Saccharopolyspora phatthalungensis]|uniref:Uma2 family endonuclease n=1 Tax=Saccharopolyspora phatthalungensis TaxID=664693 RepID=A0A840Q127_9PSEU|nr:Uma2 family endonuclease [Saccharopolyspora phatthalungensis]MBB5154064.1 Uma2 family endonuclease [Saccharopolyspora phatthalungensis]